MRRATPCQSHGWCSGAQDLVDCPLYRLLKEEGAPKEPPTLDSATSNLEVTRKVLDIVTNVIRIIYLAALAAGLIMNFVLGYR